MEGHKVEWKLLKLVSPVVILLQAFLQSLHSELCQHDFGQTYVLDLKAAPQCVHSLHTQVKCILTDEGGLSTASGTYKFKKEFRSVVNYTANTVGINLMPYL